MKDRFGLQHDMVNLQGVTSDAIREMVRKYNFGEKTRVTATQPVPLRDSSGGTLRDKDDLPLYDCFIYYETKAEDQRFLNNEGKVEEPNQKLEVD